MNAFFRPLRLSLAVLCMAMTLTGTAHAGKADLAVDMMGTSIGRKVIKAIVIHEGKVLLEGGKSKAMDQFQAQMLKHPELTEKAQRNLSEVLRTRRIHEIYTDGQIAQLRDKFRFVEWRKQAIAARRTQ